MDELDDRELAAALRGRADELTMDVVDTDAALEAVRRRSRTRRRWRGAGGGVLAAAAAAVGVLVVASVAGDDEVVRTPATAPAVESTTARTSTVAPTTVTTAAPTTLVPSTTLAPATTAVATVVPDPSVPAPPTSTAPTTAPAATTTTRDFDSAGGSIRVRLAGGAIALAGDPVPAPGFSVRIDDNGPDRVRVRFELGDERSEIRVDLQDGALVPEIIDS